MQRITCPHCWHQFGPDQFLWVAQHAELLGDPVLGPEANVRFLPTRFNVQGEALDARGMACQILACPRCHLTVPRALAENEPLFISIIGVPGSGKSYFLTAMTWELRKLLPQYLAVSFNDADTISNRNLNDYEERLFLQNDPDRLVALDKTQETGHLYDQIQLGQQLVSLPKPFLFSLRPASNHPNASVAESTGRVVCLYDNAGESFEPGKDQVGSPVTQHLARSKVLIFLYDPTKDSRFRQQCRSLSSDPQLEDGVRSQRQETILTEAAGRVRRYAGLPSNKKHERPLIVVVPKADVWASLCDIDLSTEPIVQRTGEIGLADLPRLDAASAKLRAMLMKHTPEVVAAAEDFCSTVVYLPASVFAHPPEPLAGEGSGLGIRPKHVKPRWVTAPILYMFAKWSTGLIAGSRPPGPPPVKQGGSVRKA